MIGHPIHTGTISEACPVAPRPDVRAPLVMERLLPLVRSEDTQDDARRRAQLASNLGPGWQRLVSADFTSLEGQYIYERFVGLTLRDISLALRHAERVLPIDVLRTMVEATLDGLASLEGQSLDPLLPIHLSDRSIGLGLDRRWWFAMGALNHWLADVRSPFDDNSDPLSPDVLFFLSPEAFQVRDETSASLATRAGLFVHQMMTGGYHPYRGDRFQSFPSITRYTRSEVRVPVTVHPEMTPALAEAMNKAVAFSGDRFASLSEFRDALTAGWPKPAASAERTFLALTSLCWPGLQRTLHALRHEPLLPIKWDGVWSSSRTPEEGLQVLEDQLLEAQVPLSEFPLRKPLPPQRDEPYSPQQPAAPHATPPRVAINVGNPEAPARPGLLARLLALFGGR